MQVIFDLNHLSYRCFFACRNDIQQVGYKYLHHVMFNNIINLSRRFEADKVILCVDDKQNWRKKIYPEYKAQRKENRAEDINWEEFYAEFDKFIEYCKTYFPFYVLQVKYMEADDIAAMLAKTYQNESKTIVTSDGDYIQLLRYKNVKIYDPIKSTFKKEDDPVRALKIKCLMGDKSDNIPPIKPRVGEVTAGKIADDPKLLQEILEHPELGEEYKENYKRNIRLIDLNRIPDKLLSKSIQQFESYQLVDGKGIFNFLAKNKFRDLLNRLNEIEELCLKLVETYNNSKILDGQV